MEDRKAHFYRVYSNLPLGVRDEIVVVVDGEPMTWKAVRLEVDNNTDKGQTALQQLYDMQIIGDQE